MAYIGRGVKDLSDRLVLDSITVTATDTFTLQSNSVDFVPSSASALTVSLNGIIQKPDSSYTVSSSSIIFSSALTTDDTIDFIIAERGITLQTPSAGSVGTSQLATDAVSTAKIADANVTSAKMFSGFANGITMADQWRLTADTNTSTAADITTNWERNDDASYGSIGTGLTESSGIFSFSQTGLYLILFNAISVVASNDTLARVILSVTQNNSVYDEVARANFGNGSGNAAYHSGSCSTYFDVTDITNDKFKLATGSFSTNTKLIGDTTRNHSTLLVIRLGDT